MRLVGAITVSLRDAFVADKSKKADDKVAECRHDVRAVFGPNL